MSVSFYGGFTPGTMGGGDGTPGRGIKSIKLNADGQMIITYTDGISENIGSVIGPRGYTFYPDIVENTLTWTNDGNLPNPEPFKFPTTSCDCKDDTWGTIGDSSSSKGDLEWSDISI